MSINSKDGLPKVWDERADGFVRGETIGCLLLERKCNAKRIYATLLHSRVNIDGHKKMGIFFPNSKSQEELMIKCYTEAGVDPRDVQYFEAHGTGTEVGDYQEAKAIYNAYCVKPGREGSLKIGLLKSNVGHGEAASGVASIAKVLICYENQRIPSNLHLNKLKPSIAEMCPPLQPINQNIEYDPGIVGVNSFGVGGVNGHVLLQPNYKKSDENSLKIADKIPRIVNICCRTEEALNQMFDFIEKNSNKISRDFLALLTDTMKTTQSLHSSGFPFRGSLLIKQLNESKQIKYRYERQTSVLKDKTLRQIWFLCPGLGGQWSAMAKALMPIELFATKIGECHEIMTEFGIDLKYLLLSEDKNTMSSMTNKFCATTALQIAMIDVLYKLDITPDGIIGHSFGEIACAYADGCLTTREALLVTYIRGQVTENDPNIPKGLMAVIGLSWDETNKLCPKGVHVVCNNAKDSVVVSGKYEEMKEFIECFIKKGIYVQELESYDIPYHSPYLQTCAQTMTEKLQKVVENPKKRSQKWISTAILDSKQFAINDNLMTASAEYFVHNLVSPVFFYNKLKTQVPNDAIIIEIGPHSLFAKIVTKTLENSSYMSLIRRQQNDQNLDLFLNTITNVYGFGFNPAIEHLYPTVQWPVARSTQSIGSLWRWQYSHDYSVRKYPQHFMRFSASDMNVNIDLSQSYDSYLSDHCIDGNILFPASGYVMLAWRQLAASQGKVWTQLPVVFEDIEIRRPVFLSDKSKTHLTVTLHKSTGEFNILENEKIVCFGKIYSSDDQSLCIQHLIKDKTIESFNKNSEVIALDAKDIYKDLRVRGFDYGLKFMGLKRVFNKDCVEIYGTVQWMGNWITFLDSLLQSQPLALPFRHLMIPVMISSIRCNPKELFDAINDCKQTSIETMKSTKMQNSDEMIAAKNANISLEESVKLLDQFIDSDNNSKGTADLPFFSNITNNLIVSHGIEIEGLLAIPIPRKEMSQNLKLESYLFIANEEYEATDPHLKIKIRDYIKVCTFLANKAKLMLGLNDIKSPLNNEMNEEFVKKYLNDSEKDQILLKIMNKIVNSFHDQNANELKDKYLNQLVDDLNTKPEFDLSKDIINQVSKNEPFLRPLLDIVSENNTPKRQIKVLELNSSNAIMATEVDNHLAFAAIYPIDVDYTLAVKSIDGLSEEYKNKSFKLCEWNHKTRELPLVSHTLDLIVFKDSYDSFDMDFDYYLQEFYDTLSDKAFCLSVFRSEYTETEFLLNQLNGRKCLSKSSVEQRIDSFIKTANNFGFTIICRKYDSIGSTAILMRKLQQKVLDLKDINICLIDNNYKNWFNLLKEKVIELKESEERDDSMLWLIANDSSINGIIGLTNSLRLEPGGDKIRCIFDFDKCLKLPLNSSENAIISDILINDLAINVIKGGKLGTYRHLNVDKNYDKIQTNDYFLNVGSNKDLSGIQWFDSKNLFLKDSDFTSNNRQLNKIRCIVYSAGLNFKDVMYTTGRMISGQESLFTDCLIGIEFAGRRSDTGERVCGFGISRCMASFVDIDMPLFTSIPDHWSMDESVTVMSTYITVWYGLIERAQLRQNESILIHSGAGGVGQAAIAVCQYYNCHIFTTVGNEEKKRFLIEKYNIPENMILNSRDIQFKYQIMNATNGKGVNLVLNSLVGEKFDASFQCVAKNGRFVEIGKYELIMNKKLGMFSFLKNISFIGVGVDQIILSVPELAQKFFDWMHKNCSNGCIKPINKTIFKASEASEAFRYMTTGKHIGKLIIKLRDEEQSKAPTLQFSPTLRLKATVKTYFNPKKVYIITGGLGGFGLELIHWMIFNGAKKFVLSSRSGIKTDYQKWSTTRLKTFAKIHKKFENEIIVSKNDCLGVESTRHVLEEAISLGPIGGVFHLSLVLNDCLLENQSVEQFTSTYASKVNAAIHLDQLTRDLNIDLDYFVVFSSVSCGKGNGGQTNYSFANSVVERVCEVRRADGLHGLAIQWGPIGDVGVMADTEINSSLSAIVKQRVNSCLEVLDKFLQCSQPILSSTVRQNRSSFLDNKEDKVVDQIWGMLGIDPKSTPNELTLGELGIESFFAVELQQTLERDYDLKLSLSEVKTISVKHLKDFESGKKDVLQKYSIVLKESRNNLNFIKFLIPKESHSLLNDNKTGKPLYFLPSIEGIFSSIHILAKHINRPVIGLNWTQDMKHLKTMKQISEYYSDLLKQLEPNGAYDVIGMSFGALIVSKMLKKHDLNHAVIIDVLSEPRLEDNVSEEYIFDFVIQWISQILPQTLMGRIIRDLNSVKSIDEKLQRIGREIKEFGGKTLVTKDLEEVLNNAFQASKLMTEYRVKAKHKCKQNLMTKSAKLCVIKLIDVSKDIDLNELISDSYFISKTSMEGRLVVQTIQMSECEETIDVTLNKMAQIINQCMA